MNILNEIVCICKNQNPGMIQRVSCDSGVVWCKRWI